jgi:NAD(P)H-flavin reductase
MITHTIQDVGAISHACCELSVGDEVGIRGPFGNPFPVEDAKFKDVIILAGGVGFAPLRPMIEYIAYNRDDYGEVNFLYGTRDPSGILFHQDVISLQSDPSINFQITVDHSYKNWRGNVGVVTSLLDKAEFDPKNTMAFVCGPEIMMRYGTYELIDWEIPEDNIFLSMERNMKCALGHCGHCQYGPHFVCKEGPVFSYPSIRKYLNILEI